MPSAITSRADAGFSLVEVLATAAVMTVTLVGLGSVFISSHRSQQMAIEEALVSHAFRRTVEQMRGEVFADIATLYDGYQFTVDDVDAAGTVTILVDETATVPELGLPRDLDGDGAATTTDVTGSYILLPVRVDVTWPGDFGQETRTLYTYLSEES